MAISLTDTGKNMKLSNITANKFRISYVNGIHHSKEDWMRITNYLSKLFGTNIRPFYNPSSGSWATDATRIGIALVGKNKSDLKIAQYLADHLKLLLDEVGPNGRVLHLSHSGGKS